MKKVYLAFLWHHHQPVYKNPSTGYYELPWVRLHATKDYYDTAAILDEFPLIKSNFNLVPSLLAQLDEYAQGIAKDKYLELTLKPAGELTEDDRMFVLHNFFMANWDTMINLYPRYLELLEKRGRQTSWDELRRIQKYFKTHDIRDLQVWFNLAWMDPYWREKDEFVKSLFSKARDFNEEEKQALVKKQLEICGLIAGKYRQLQERGQIEVSTSPFYHPILPLLSDTNNALMAIPHLTLPKKRFQHREDAKIQIQKAIEYYTRCFGKPPAGMWPSEGSVSEDIISIFTQAGIKWIASDEEVLFRSNPKLNGQRTNIYKTYHLNISDNQLDIIFRDHALSDAIGFIYGRWNPKDAALDFVKRIHFIRDSFASLPDTCLISVILDGENCWEYYSNDGWDFLRQLYQTLSDDPTIETVTINEFLQKNPPQDTLKTLWSGSWINSNFHIWIGHPEDNMAWQYLTETRAFLSEYSLNHPEKKDSPALKAAWEKIYIAEGSDWNWWYGDDHFSGNDDIFDRLFRQHLISVYELLGEKVPDYLYKAIKGITKKYPTLEPIDFIAPNIDGIVTNYFEWLPAGFYSVGHSGGSMHQVETILKSFHYGFDMENLYFRLDLNIPLNSNLIDELSFRIIFLSPSKREIFLSFEQGGKIREFFARTPSGNENLMAASAQKIIEFTVPLSKLEFPNEYSNIEFVVLIFKNNSEVERWPYQSSVVLPKPTQDFTLKTWSV